MTDCLFILEHKSDLWECSLCHWRCPVPMDKPPRRNCLVSPTAVRYGHRLLRLYLLSRYRASQATRPLPAARAFYRRCLACDRLVGENCRDCGCSRRGDDPLHVRLADAAGACPRGKW